LKKGETKTSPFSKGDKKPLPLKREIERDFNRGIKGVRYLEFLEITGRSL